ncbi:NmrA/HSCARG family protein [Amycolatopsis cynarae]|uniref:NmrA/HSCARG family protein n=1 Tax=Amycolatopsis cynarae TaxID=2995223 RepID=A0ABY7B3S7_9PSEU|nr:NmrA/HSCARG family protein [Amycolatopsis sp. HUAS 11-8]WAL65468.1 NmrA/HSCARG family protein [Amycolatopsis sp. HUAS 11-8]
MDRTALVTGATGQQGGAVAARLLADGWQVRTLTRDPTSPKARALAEAGAEVVAGDLADPASVERHMRGVHGVFSVHPGPKTPDQDEFLAGKNVADAARRAEVEHLVYSSGLGADMLAEKGLQKDKWAIERYLRELGISATVLRPSSFMENYFMPIFGLRDGALRTALNPGTRQQLIALEDIAAFTALALSHPDDYRGQTLELAGDGLTPGEIAAAVSAATGMDVPYVHLSLDDLRKIDERYARGYELMNSIKEPIADIDDLRRRHPGLLTFSAWLERTGAAKLKEILA